MRRRHVVSPGGHTVRCAICGAHINPHMAETRTDGNHLCPDCQGLANLLTGTIAREAAHRAGVDVFS